MKVSAFIKRKIAKAKGGSGRRRTSASDPGDGDVAAAAGLHRHSKKNLQVDNGNGPPSHSHRRQTEGTEDTISLSMLIGDDNLSSEACEAGKINSEFGSSRPSRLVSAPTGGLSRDKTLGSHALPMVSLSEMGNASGQCPFKHGTVYSGESIVLLDLILMMCVKLS